jgi:hypothetical protein
MLFFLHNPNKNIFPNLKRIYITFEEEKSYTSQTPTLVMEILHIEKERTKEKETKEI